jgi:hypothetical protein
MLSMLGPSLKRGFRIDLTAPWQILAVVAASHSDNTSFTQVVGKKIDSKLSKPMMKR